MTGEVLTTGLPLTLTLCPGTVTGSGEVTPGTETGCGDGVGLGMTAPLPDGWMVEPELTAGAEGEEPPP